MSYPLPLLVGCGLVLILLVAKLSRRGRNLTKLRGPAAPSRIFGNEYEILHQRETATLDLQWMREYGSTWRTRSYFGVDQIMTADPKALQHILHKSGYNYPKRVDMNHAILLAFGPGILWSDGAMHQRYRKVMNPAFGAQQLRGFIPLFQRTAHKVVEKWRVQISEEPDGLILVNKWLGRAVLDIVTEAAFDYNFGSLDDDSGNKLAKEYNTLGVDTQLYPNRVVSDASRLGRAYREVRVRAVGGQAAHSTGFPPESRCSPSLRARRTLGPLCRSASQLPLTEPVCP